MYKQALASENVKGERQRPTAEASLRCSNIPTLCFLQSIWKLLWFMSFFILLLYKKIFMKLLPCWSIVSGDKQNCIPVPWPLVFGSRKKKWSSILFEVRAVVFMLTLPPKCRSPAQSEACRETELRTKLKREQCQAEKDGGGADRKQPSSVPSSMRAIYFEPKPFFCGRGGLWSCRLRSLSSFD